MSKPTPGLVATGESWYVKSGDTATSRSLTGNGVTHKTVSISLKKGDTR